MRGRETRTRRGNEGDARVGRAREGEVLKSERTMRGREGGIVKDGGCGVQLWGEGSVSNAGSS